MQIQTMENYFSAKNPQSIPYMSKLCTVELLNKIYLFLLSLKCWTSSEFFMFNETFSNEKHFLSWKILRGSVYIYIVKGYLGLPSITHSIGEQFMLQFGNFAHKTSKELRMLSNVTLNCQVAKIVMNSGSQRSKL